MDQAEMMQDLLMTQKQLECSYNEVLSETDGEELRKDLLKILQDEHLNHAAVFHTMEKKGWYETRPADQTTVKQIRNAFKQKAPESV